MAHATEKSKNLAKLYTLDYCRSLLDQDPVGCARLFRIAQGNEKDRCTMTIRDIVRAGLLAGGGTVFNLANFGRQYDKTFSAGDVNSVIRNLAKTGEAEWTGKIWMSTAGTLRPAMNGSAPHVHQPPAETQPVPSMAEVRQELEATADRARELGMMPPSMKETLRQKPLPKRIDWGPVMDLLPMTNAGGEATVPIPEGVDSRLYAQRLRISLHSHRLAKDYSWTVGIQHPEDGSAEVLLVRNVGNPSVELPWSAPVTFGVGDKVSSDAAGNLHVERVTEEPNPDPQPQDLPLVEMPPAAIPEPPVPSRRHRPTNTAQQLLDACVKVYGSAVDDLTDCEAGELMEKVGNLSTILDAERNADSWVELYQGFLEEDSPGIWGRVSETDTTAILNMLHTLLTEKRLLEKRVSEYVVLLRKSGDPVRADAVMELLPDEDQKRLTTLFDKEMAAKKVAGKEAVSGR